MRYVTDSSAWFKWVVPEVHSDKADRLRNDYRNAVHELLAPDIFPAEVAHALTRAERQGRIVQSQAILLWADIMSTAPRFVPTASLLPRANRISSQARIGVYDCLYVALAEQEQCEFVTADDKLVKNLKHLFPFIVPLASLP